MPQGMKTACGSQFTSQVQELTYALCLSGQHLHTVNHLMESGKRIFSSPTIISQHVSIKFAYLQILC